MSTVFLTDTHINKVFFLSLYPDGDITVFADRAFDRFDEDKNGLIDFREFVLGLNITSRGTMEQKLRWP